MPGDSFGETGEGIPTALLHTEKQETWSYGQSESYAIHVQLALPTQELLKFKNSFRLGVPREVQFLLSKY